MMKLETVNIKIPEGANVIIGQSHFIKTCEDIYEIIVNTNPAMKFGIAFSEASGKRLIRYEGNDQNLIDKAINELKKISAGHIFLIMLKDGYPINILPSIKQIPEVCRIFAATANILQVVVVETEQGRGVIGVVDGSSPLGVETEDDIKERREFIRMIGYKK